MSTTAQWVFEKTVYLMGEACQSTGLADYADTKDYKNRTLGILNVLRVECFPACGGGSVSGAGTLCPEITGFESPLPLDDHICQGVLPYGLAAQLLLEENPTAASYFQQKYAELLYEAKRSRPTQSEAVADLYGGIEYGKFGRW